MNIQEAKDEKRRAEAAIAEVLNQFRNSTGAVITSISINAACDGMGNVCNQWVSAEAKL